MKNRIVRKMILEAGDRLSEYLPRGSRQAPRNTRIRQDSQADDEDLERLLPLTVSHDENEGGRRSIGMQRSYGGEPGEEKSRWSVRFEYGGTTGAASVEWRADLPYGGQGNFQMRVVVEPLLENQAAAYAEIVWQGTDQALLSDLDDADGVAVLEDIERRLGAPVKDILVTSSQDYEKKAIVGPQREVFQYLWSRFRIHVSRLARHDIDSLRSELQTDVSLNR